jgi:hypothetical protein
VNRASARDGETSPPPNVETTTAENPAPGFDRSWIVWPAASGRKQARETCLAHWIANGLEAHRHLIVAHVEAMTRTQHWRTGGDPTPIRYLEGKRWQDCTPAEIEAAAEAQQGADDVPWYRTDEGVAARARAISFRDIKQGESPAIYRVLVVKAASDRKGAEYVLQDAQRFNSVDLYQFARRTLGDALLPVDDFPS